MNELRPETTAAVEAVKRALTVACRGVGVGEVTLKGERDPVTTSDVAIEDAIREILGEAVGVPVIGEERGGEAPPDGSPYWLVDPICGTRNFASGIPLYCVNVALVERGVVTAAVVGDASTGGIDVAERGHGAWRVAGGERERLRTSADSRTVVIEDGKSKADRRERAAQYWRAIIRTDRWDVRSLGTTLASSYVADGRVAAYVLFFASAVHIAAGSLLITEAGGVVSDIDGRRWTVDSDSLVGSADSQLHEELLGLGEAEGG